MVQGDTDTDGDCTAAQSPSAAGHSMHPKAMAASGAKHKMESGKKPQLPPAKQNVVAAHPTPPAFPGGMAPTAKPY